MKVHRYAVSVLAIAVAVVPANARQKSIPPTDEGGLSIAALNRMIAAAVRGVKARAQ
jgi:hypothetical protein